MLNKPNKIRKFAMLSMALTFWLSSLSLFAQSNKTMPTEPQKKQIPATQSKPTLSNQQPKNVKQDQATIKKIEMQKARKEELATASKKQSLAKENAKETKKSNQVHSTSSKAPVKTAENTPSKNDVKANNTQQDWDIKKAKIVADLKAKGASQYDIDKRITAMEKKMNTNNNSNK
jgi:hypothetical protein